MKRTRHALLIAFSFVMLLCCAVADVPCAGSSSARAQQVEGPRKSKTPVAGPVILLPTGQVEQTESTQVENTKRIAATKRWEYCAIIGIEWVGNPPATVAVIRYFPSRTESVEGASREDAQANAIAKLGEEGWEMVGISRVDSSYPVFYFKRAK